MNSIETLKHQIYEILEKHPHSRNSDKVLAVELYKKFYPEHVVVVGEKYYYSVLDLPPEESIKRLREGVDGLRRNGKRLLVMLSMITRGRGVLSL